MALSTRLRLQVSPGARRGASEHHRAVSGRPARDKIVELAGIDEAEIDRRLEQER